MDVKDVSAFPLLQLPGTFGTLLSLGDSVTYYLLPTTIGYILLTKKTNILVILDSNGIVCTCMPLAKSNKNTCRANFLGSKLDSCLLIVLVSVQWPTCSWTEKLMIIQSQMALLQEKWKTNHHDHQLDVPYKWKKMCVWGGGGGFGPKIGNITQCLYCSSAMVVAISHS